MTAAGAARIVNRTAAEDADIGKGLEDKAELLDGDIDELLNHTKDMEKKGVEVREELVTAKE